MFFTRYVNSQCMLSSEHTPNGLEKRRAFAYRAKNTFAIVKTMVATIKNLVKNLVATVKNAVGTVRGENCILSFVFTLLSIRVLCVLCCFLIVFSFHLGEAAQFVMVLKRKLVVGVCCGHLRDC